MIDLFKIKTNQILIITTSRHPGRNGVWHRPMVDVSRRVMLTLGKGGQIVLCLLRSSTSSYDFMFHLPVFCSFPTPCPNSSLGAVFKPTPSRKPPKGSFIYSQGLQKLVCNGYICSCLWFRVHPAHSTVS